jgi:hypothetical protein
MECASCGSTLVSEARFCRRCGAPAPLGPSATARSEPTRRAWTVAAAVFALVVVIAAATAGLLRFAPGLLGQPDRVSGPSSAELRRKLATELPAYLEVVSLDVRASENAGDRVQPLFRTRFQAVVELAEPTFREVAREGEALIVAAAGAKGARRQVFGLAVSELRSEEWSTVFHLENDPRLAFGLPRDAFDGGRVVVQGSPGEREYRAEQRRRAEAAEAAAREQQLLAAEIERRQREAEEEDRRQSLARLRAPIVASIRDRRALVGEASKFLAGSSSFRMRFTTCDEVRGAVAGVIDYGDCETRFEGQLADERLVLTETEFVRFSGGCTIGRTWRLHLDEKPWTGEIEPPRGADMLGQAMKTNITIHVD